MARIHSCHVFATKISADSVDSRCALHEIPKIQPINRLELLAGAVVWHICAAIPANREQMAIRFDALRFGKSEIILELS